MNMVLLGVIGLLGGFLSGLLGLGGGIVFVPLLVCFRQMDIHLAVGTSLAVILPTALAGMMIHQHFHSVAWHAVFVLALFAILGAWLGANLSLNLSALHLKRIFAVFLMAVAIKMFFGQ